MKITKPDIEEMKRLVYKEPVAMLNPTEEYLKQNKFNALDEYDDQLIHENLDSNQNNVDDIDKLKSEIDNFEKLSNGSFMKAEHVSNFLSKVNKKKRDIDSQIKYMKSHEMENSALYKKLEGFSEKLNSIKRKLKNIDV